MYEYVYIYIHMTASLLLGAPCSDASFVLALLLVTMRSRARVVGLGFRV